jgi:MoaA/NifB/PqqE/SkfB family radical SAM enzyme
MKGEAAVFNAICADTISACNRRCPFCMYGTERWRKREYPRQPGMMSWENIERILAELAALDFRGRVSWYRINEPMLDKRIVEIYRRTREVLPEAVMTMITNGDLMTPEKFSALMDAGVEEISVSIYDDEGFSHYLRLKEHARRNGHHAPIPKDRRDPAAFATNRAGAVPGFGKEIFGGPCARPWTMLNLTAGGDAVICCCDMFRDEVVGNVFESSLLEVWNGEVFTRYREELARGRRENLKVCSKCNYRGFGHKVRNSDPEIPPNAFSDPVDRSSAGI